VLEVGTQSPVVAAQPVFGQALLVPDSSGRPVALFFLRYLGSSVCRLQMAAIQTALGRFEMAGVRVAAVTRSGLRIARDQVPRYHVLYPVCCDPEGAIFEQFNVGRDRGFVQTAKSLINGGAVTARRAFQMGHGVFEGSEDQRSAAFLIDAEGKICWAWYGQGVLDCPDIEAMLMQVE
jgi:peroxiredoxin